MQEEKSDLERRVKSLGDEMGKMKVEKEALEKDLVERKRKCDSQDLVSWGPEILDRDPLRNVVPYLFMCNSHHVCRYARVILSGRQGPLGSLILYIGPWSNSNSQWQILYWVANIS